MKMPNINILTKASGAMAGFAAAARVVTQRVSFAARTLAQFFSARGPSIASGFGNFFSSFYEEVEEVWERIPTFSFLDFAPEPVGYSGGGGYSGGSGFSDLPAWN